ncbi:hypothetical protein KQX54_019013 [Cotesia glomerata]|uniref:Uncharacterized protein n=1 Tax=Cotesia glomerata TaxID=32391 RepID=A0AAV7I458_COTGL|nr:hypothetical protein KQX54_019013 [Cotesia glomerata]
MQQRVPVPVIAERTVVQMLPNQWLSRLRSIPVSGVVYSYSIRSETRSHSIQFPRIKPSKGSNRLKFIAGAIPLALTVYPNLYSPPHSYLYPH